MCGRLLYSNVILCSSQSYKLKLYMINSFLYVHDLNMNQLTSTNTFYIDRFGLLRLFDCFCWSRYIDALEFRNCKL